LSAAVPGKRALMMNDEAVLAMKRGSVIVDLAAPTGGNVSLSCPEETIVTSNGVMIFAPLNLAATVPYHASQLFSRNMTFQKMVCKIRPPAWRNSQGQ